MESMKKEMSKSCLECSYRKEKECEGSLEPCLFPIISREAYESIKIVKETKKKRKR